MKFNELVAPKAKSKNRVGRGISAGRGKTAGRGTKGQGARKSSTKAGFSGGQTPLVMQIPKLRGFKSKRKLVENVYTGQLDSVKKVTIDNQALADAGLISSAHVKVKVILKGEIKGKKTVKVQGYSAEAKKAIEKAGGAADVVVQVPRVKQKIAKTEA
jgi:large subunit ribosomal protein L15